MKRRRGSLKSELSAAPVLEHAGGDLHFREWGAELRVTLVGQREDGSAFTWTAEEPLVLTVAELVDALGPKILDRRFPAFSFEGARSGPPTRRKNEKGKKLGPDVDLGRGRSPEEEGA